MYVHPSICHPFYFTLMDLCSLHFFNKKSNLYSCKFSIHGFKMHYYANLLLKNVWLKVFDWCSLFLPPFAHVISVFGPMYDFKFCRRALKTRFICLQRKSLAYYSLEPALKMKHTIFLIKRPHGNTHDSPALSYWDSALTQPCWYVLEKTQETMC